MSNIIIILEILLISLGLTVVNLLFIKFFGLSGEEMKKMQETSRNLQERMRNSQKVGDYEEIKRLQQESIEMTKKMFKKQIPQCILCFVILFGVFFPLRIIYAPYNTGLLPFTIPLFGSGWYAVYILSYFVFIIIYYAVRKVYRKLTGKEEGKERQGIIKQLLGFGSSSEESNNISGFHIPETKRINSSNVSKTMNKEDESSKEGNNSQSNKSSWKDRL